MFPIPSTLLIKIGAAVAALAFAWFLGWNHEHKNFVEYKTEIAALGKAQEVINQAKAKEHETITTSIANQYEARLSAVHNYYSQRVQHAGPGAMPAVSQPTGCANATCANAVPAGQCAETTLQLTELQNWIRSIK
jgi:hypothetical protein